jgi:hydroxyacylglutathione hydrolase
LKHIVTEMPQPFRLASDAIEVHQIPSWTDNLIWLLVDTQTGEAAAVDGPRATEVLEYCGQKGYHLTTIFNADHIGINTDLAKRGLLDNLRVVGSATRRQDIPGITEAVSDGDTVTFAGVSGDVLLTEGHIDGHISFVFEDALFCGDTLFTGGCGYLFDGPPEAMWRSLSRLAELHPATRVCCAHEYTQDNLRFAWSLEPGNKALAQRIAQVWKRRARGESTVPSDIALERATNPFLRSAEPELVARVSELTSGLDTDDPCAVFAATRALKDQKAYRSMGDTLLPLVN